MDFFQKGLHNVMSKISLLLRRDSVLFSQLTQLQQERYDRGDLSLRKRSHFLIQNTVEMWRELCLNCFIEEYPQLKILRSDQQFYKLCFRLIDIIEPWNEPMNEIILTDSNIIKLHRLTIDSTSEQIDIQSFNVFGCPHSRDIDVIVAVASPHLITNGNMHLLESDLKLKLAEIGYDVNRGLDINLCYALNGNIHCISNGGRETQNILFQTYDLHRQAYPCIVTSNIEIDIMDKLKATAKFILDHLEVLIGKKFYQVVRSDRKEAYKKSEDSIDFSNKMCSYILDNINESVDLTLNNIQWRNFMKSLVMKIIQLILQFDSIETSYTKMGLTEKFDSLYQGSKESILWFLFYGTKGVFDIAILIVLFQQYNWIVHELNTTYEPLQFQPIQIDMSSVETSISNDLLSEFLKSASEPTSTFEVEFDKVCPNRDLNDFFQVDPIGAEYIPSDLNAHLHQIQQRSGEWLDLLRFYKCGTSLGVTPLDPNVNWVKFYYNLIRGNIIEQMVISGGNFDSILGVSSHKITVGLLVREKKQGSPGCSPDLLLKINVVDPICSRTTTTGNIIPVEIKCINSRPNNNHDYRRSIKLATKQLESTIDILSVALPSNPRMGIICIVYFYDDGGRQPIVDCQGTVIHF